MTWTESSMSADRSAQRLSANHQKQIHFQLHEPLLLALTTSTFSTGHSIVCSNQSLFTEQSFYSSDPQTPVQRTPWGYAATQLKQEKAKL
jgi:hypothetical protein